MGNSYGNGEGVEVDDKKAKHYYELAAMGGSISARHNIGCVEGDAGNYQRAYKHFVISAKAGHEGSLDIMKQGVTHGLITKDVYTAVSRVCHDRQKEMKSDMREAAKEMERNVNVNE